jgi:uncharacterized protein
MIFRGMALAAFLLLSPACRTEPARALAQSQCGEPQADRAGPGQAQSGLAIAPLEIRTASKTRKFRVEIAGTPDEQSIGMMFRDSVGRNEGMIFPFPRPRPAAFWMKNTRIPLDLIFVRADGTIARIAANAVPYCLDPVQVGEPVAAVLEIGGGRAGQLGIAEGDRVTWSGVP